ncbi:hypothetical protein FRC00_011691, partial [Tulasnella sp. 408]
NHFTQTVAAVTRGVAHLILGTAAERRQRNDYDRDSVSTWSGDEETYQEYVERVIREDAQAREEFRQREEERSQRALQPVTNYYGEPVYNIQRRTSPTLQELQQRLNSYRYDEPPSPTAPPSLVPIYEDSPSPEDAQEAITPQSDTAVDSDEEISELELPAPLIAQSIPTIRAAGVPINDAFIQVNEDGSISLALVDALNQAIEIDSNDLDDQLWSLREHREEVRQEIAGAQEEHQELSNALDALEEQVNRIESVYDRILHLPRLSELEFFRDSALFEQLSPQAREAILREIATRTNVPTPPLQITDTRPWLAAVPGEVDAWTPLPTGQLPDWTGALAHVREPDHYDPIANNYYTTAATYVPCHFDEQPNQLNDCEEFPEGSAPSLSTLPSPVVHRTSIGPPLEPVFYDFATDQSGILTTIEPERTNPNDNYFPPLDSTTVTHHTSQERSNPDQQSFHEWATADPPTGFDISAFDHSTSHYEHPRYGHFIDKHERAAVLRQYEHLYDDGLDGDEDVALQGREGLWNATKKEPLVDSSDATKTARVCAQVILHIDEILWNNYIDTLKFDDGQKIWADLSSKYGKTTLVTATHTLASLVRYSINEGDNINDSFNEMENLRRIISAGKITVDDTSFAVYMLSALPPSFESFRSTLYTTLDDAAKLTPEIVRTRVQFEYDRLWSLGQGLLISSFW